MKNDGVEGNLGDGELNRSEESGGGKDRSKPIKIKWIPGTRNPTGESSAIDVNARGGVDVLEEIDAEVDETMADIEEFEEEFAGLMESGGRSENQPRRLARLREKVTSWMNKNDMLRSLWNEEMTDTDLADMDKAMEKMSEMNPGLGKEIGMVAEVMKRAVGMKGSGIEGLVNRIDGVDLEGVAVALKEDDDGVIKHRMEALNMVNKEMAKGGSTHELMQLQRSLKARLEGKSLEESGFDEMERFIGFEEINSHLGQDHPDLDLQEVMDAIRVSDGGVSENLRQASEFLDDQIEQAGDAGVNLGSLRKLKRIVEMRRKGMPLEDAELIVTGKLRDKDKERMGQVDKAFAGRESRVIQAALGAYFEKVTDQKSGEEVFDTSRLDEAMEIVDQRMAKPGESDDPGVLRSIKESLMERRSEVEEEGLVAEIGEEGNVESMYSVLEAAVKGVINANPDYKKVFGEGSEKFGEIMKSAKEAFKSFAGNEKTRKYAKWALYFAVAVVVIFVVGSIVAFGYGASLAASGR